MFGKIQTWLEQCGLNLFGSKPEFPKGMTIDGVDVEPAMNAMKTLSTAELGVIDGVVAGTAAAGKAVVLGPGKVLDEIDLTSIKKGGVAIADSAADLNLPKQITYFRSLTETTGAGTYTATVAVPAGYSAEVILHQVALWTATTSATLNAGDDDSANGFFDGIDLKAAPAAGGNLSSLSGAAGCGAYGGALKAYAEAKTITVTVVTVGAAGNAGRSQIQVNLYKTANAVAAAAKA